MRAGSGGHMAISRKVDGAARTAVNTEDSVHGYRSDWMFL